MVRVKAVRVRLIGHIADGEGVAIRHERNPLNL
jgi:hypothetical protein